MRRTLKEIQEFQAEFDKAHFGAIPFFEPIDEGNVEALEHLVVCIVGELGELANLVKKVRRGDSTLAESRAFLIDETADVFIYLVKLANQMNVDLDIAYKSKMDRNEDRFEKYRK